MRYLLHDVFLESVKKYPHNIAVYHESGQKFSYDLLNNMSNHVAQVLLELKPQPIAQAPLVGVLSYVNAHSIAAVLGILKIGAAYVPLDEQSPLDRLEKIVKNSQLETLVIDAYFFAEFQTLLLHSQVRNIVVLSDEFDYSLPGKHVVQLNLGAQSNHPEPTLLNQVSDDLAYILHSSGSTGIPKGIMLSHRNARTFVDWMNKEFKLNAADVVMSRAPFKFDLSVFDVFNTLSVGAAVVCYDWRIPRQGSQKHIDYVQLVQRSKATFLYTTPSTLMVLVNQGRLGEEPNSLRTIMYAGEPFPIPQLKQLKAALAHTRIANIYGPTETNIITYFWIDEIKDSWQSVPLGQVVDDTEIIVVNDETGLPCQANEIGELWCRGGTVTLGYLGDADKTAQHVVQSPSHPYPARFWRTGDFGYYDADGVLHYKGRRDHMVKIKGYRIEIGEVEAAIASMAQINEFCVVAIKDDRQQTQLQCYYSSKSAGSIPNQQFIEHLESLLPQYMIPSAFQFMYELPHTSSGKVDRVCLANHATKEETDESRATYN